MAKTARRRGDQRKAKKSVTKDIALRTKARAMPSVSTSADRKRKSSQPESSAMKKPTKETRHQRPVSSSDPDLTYEPETDVFVDTSKVITDLELARTPRSDVAREVAAQARGSAMVDWIKTRRAGGGAIFDINPYDLWLEAGWNARNFDTQHRKRKIGALALSIANSGVKETLIAHIKGDKVFVHSGWNRLLATYHAIEEYGKPIYGISVRFGRSGENDGDRKASQILNNMSDPLTPIEFSVVCKDLIQLGWTIDQIAARSGRQATSIRQSLELQELPTAVLRLVGDGRDSTVSAHFATTEFHKSGEDPERTLASLRAAIETASARGSDRVLPKHAPNAPPRRPYRTRQMRLAEAQGEVMPSGPLAVNVILRKLRDILNRAGATALEDGEVVLLRVALDDWHEAKHLLEPAQASEIDPTLALDDLTEPTMEPIEQVTADDDGVTDKLGEEADQLDEIDPGQQGENEDEGKTVSEHDDQPIIEEEEITPTTVSDA